MFTNQINRRAKQRLGSAYLGAWPLNRVPIAQFNHRKLQHFIINTQTSNLPGQHWIAVSIHQRRAYIFDSFGQPPPRLLIKALRHGGITQRGGIYYNTQQVQTYGTKNCGELALRHLFNMHLRGGIGGLSRWKTLIH